MKTTALSLLLIAAAHGQTAWVNRPHTPADDVWGVTCAGKTFAAVTAGGNLFTSALLLTLAPGAYTAVVTSAAGRSGTALFEAYVP